MGLILGETSALQQGVWARGFESCLANSESPCCKAGCSRAPGGGMVPGLGTQWDKWVQVQVLLGLSITCCLDLPLCFFHWLPPCPMHEGRGDKECIPCVASFGVFGCLCRGCCGHWV